MLYERYTNVCFLIRQREELKVKFILQLNLKSFLGFSEGWGFSFFKGQVNHIYT